MPDDGGYHEDSYEQERTWRRPPELPASALEMTSTALIAVSALGVLGWVWVTLRSQGVIGDWMGLSDGVDLPERIDMLVSSLDQLVVAAIGLALGVALRRHADTASA